MAIFERYDCIHVANRFKVCG